MTERDVSMCPDIDKNLAIDPVCNLAYSSVFEASNEDFKKLLVSRYEQMKNYWREVAFDARDQARKLKWNLCGCETMLTGCKDARLKVPTNRIWTETETSNIRRLSEEPNFGHDLPVWFCRSELKDRRGLKRVMFIAQDPLRRGDEGGVVYLSSPFSLHCKTYRDDYRVGNFMDIFWSVVESGAIVYSTDYLKWFAKEADWVIKKLPNAAQKAVEILNREIRLVNPTLIVTFGKSASCSVNRDLSENFSKRMLPRNYGGRGNVTVGKNRVPTLAFLHPTGTNANAIKRAAGSMKEYVKFVKEKIINSLEYNHKY